MKDSASCSNPWQLGLVRVCVTCALAMPFLWSQATATDATLLHNLIAIVAWGLLLVLFGCLPSPMSGNFRIGLELLVGTSIVFGVACLFLGHRTPWAVSALVVLMACTVVLQWAASDVSRDVLAKALVLGVAVAALFNAFVAIVQFLVPFQTGGLLMAFPPMTGRFTGNLFQPNHLANLCLLGLGSCLYLASPGSRWRSWWLATAWLLCGGVVLSGSRMGLVGLLMLVAWGIADFVRGRDLASARLALVPLAGFWFALRWVLANYSGLAFFEGYSGPVLGPSNVEALTSTRNVIWKHALVLLQDHIWTGVGWGKFGVYWALTPLEGRSEALFGHAHNLFLHLAVELGLPFALALLVFIAWFGFRALKRAHASPSDQLQHGCLLYLWAVMLLHSQLEYPLWYSYFFLPFTALCGLLGRDVFLANYPGSVRPLAIGQSTLGLVRRGVAVAAGSLVSFAAIHAWHDYRTRVEPLFSCFQCSPPARSEALVARARSSFWFGEVGNLVYLTDRTTHLGAERLADFGPLMIQKPNIPLLVTLGRALDAHGQQAYADHIANRLRESQVDEVQKGMKCEQPSQEFFCRKPGADLSVEEMLRIVEIR
jgi:hypothetical protein